MSDEIERIKKSSQNLVRQSVGACSRAYLLEFQKECQSRGAELAKAAAKIKEDRKNTLETALNANKGRFRILREKNQELQKQNTSLSQEEQNELNAYEKNLSDALKPIKAAEEQLKNEATPFDKIYRIISDLAIRKQGNPKLDVSKAFDEYKDTAEYQPEDEWKRITDNDKLVTLFYLKDFAQNYGLTFAKIGQAVPDKNSAPEEYAAYTKSMDTMMKTAERYMIGREKVDSDGQVLVGSSIFSDTNNSIISMTNILFSSDKKGRDIVGDTYKRMIDFCNKKSSQMIMDNLDKETTIQGSPYFNEENTAYSGHIEQIRNIKSSVKFLTKEDKKSLTDIELNKAKLSFGRSGSSQFTDMETALKDFQKRLNDYVKDSENVQKKYLLQASIERLDKNAAAYLEYKDKQIQNKEIGSKKIVEDGKTKVVPSNSKTLQRMNFAEKIREEMSKQRKLFADKDIKVAKGKDMNNKPQSMGL